MPPGWQADEVEGVSYLLDPIDETQQAFFEARNSLQMYAFVRDIHYENGLQLILPASLSAEEVDAKLAQTNAIVPCSSKLFSLPQAFLVKPELVDDTLANLAAHPIAQLDEFA